MVHGFQQEIYLFVQLSPRWLSCHHVSSNGWTFSYMITGGFTQTKFEARHVLERRQQEGPWTRDTMNADNISCLWTPDQNHSLVINQESVDGWRKIKDIHGWLGQQLPFPHLFSCDLSSTHRSCDLTWACSTKTEQTLSPEEAQGFLLKAPKQAKRQSYDSFVKLNISKGQELTFILIYCY